MNMGADEGMTQDPSKLHQDCQISEIYSSLRGLGGCDSKPSCSFFFFPIAMRCAAMKARGEGYDELCTMKEAPTPLIIPPPKAVPPPPPGAMQLGGTLCGEGLLELLLLLLLVERVGEITLDVGYNDGRPLELRRVCAVGELGFGIRGPPRSSLLKRSSCRSRESGERGRCMGCCE